MTTYQRVENILKSVPHARDSDKELFIVFMQKFGMALSDIQIATFKRMPSMESIRRSRQRIQELGKYLPSPDVDRKRFEKYKKVKQNIKSESPDKLIDQGYTTLPWGKG